MCTTVLDGNLSRGMDGNGLNVILAQRHETRHLTRLDIDNSLGKHAGTVVAGALDLRNRMDVGF
jgi:hypothetical protein